jgi:hypothetical protein
MSPARSWSGSGRLPTRPRSTGSSRAASSHIPHGPCRVLTKTQRPTRRRTRPPSRRRTRLHPPRDPKTREDRRPGGCSAPSLRPCCWAALRYDCGTDPPVRGAPPHNPEVAGSNPTPLLKGPGGRKSKGPFVMRKMAPYGPGLSLSRALEARNLWSQYGPGSRLSPREGAHCYGCQ